MAELNTNKSGTGNSTSVTVTKSGPQTYGGGMFNANDLAGSLMGLISQQATAITNLGQQMTGQQSQASTQGNDALELGKQAAAEKYVLATKQADTEFQQNKFLEQLQAQYNMDPRAVNNEISKNIAVRNSLEPQIAAVESERQVAKAEYDAAAGTDLLSNPVGYLIAQLKLPALAARHNALAQNKDALQADADQATTNISTRLQLLDKSKTTLLANQSDQIRENRLAEAKVNQIIADQQLKSAEAANSARDAGFTMQQIQLANMGFDNTRQGLMGIAQLRDMNDQMKWRQTQRAQMEELRKDALDRKKADAEQDAALDARLKIVSDQLGLVLPMTVHRLRGMADKQEQEKWLYAASKASYGADLGAALDFYIPAVNEFGASAGGSGGMLDTAKRLRQTGEQARYTVESVHLAKTGKPLNSKEAAALGFQAAQAELESSTRSVAAGPDLASSKYDEGKTYNPYRAPVAQFTRLVQTDPRLASMKNNLVVKAVSELNAAGQFSGQDIPAQQQQAVLDSIKLRVAKGEIPLAQAAANIAEFYRTAAEYNRAQTNYNLFGLGVQQQYLFGVEGTAGRIKTDLFNPDSIKNTLTRHMVQDRMWRDFGPAAGPLNLGFGIGESLGIKGKLSGE